MNIVDAAMLIAIETTGVETNPHNGEIYTLHLGRVWINVKDAGGGYIEQAAAWLHDSVEDGHITLEDLRNRLSNICFDREMVNAVCETVDIVSKNDGESNEAYYHRIKNYPYARTVKLGDIKDNFRRNYLIEDDAKRLRMAKKYSMGVDILS